jgi:hypothetical protein
MNAKKRVMLLVLFFMLISSINQAQSLEWDWVRNAEGSSYIAGEGVATDFEGNVFITGSFEDPTITFGMTTLSNSDATGNSLDIFIVKYDKTGDVVWAKSLGGSKSDYVKTIVSDVDGNVYIAGSFRSPSFALETTTLNNLGYSDMFIIKYDNNGNEVWAIRAGGEDSEEVLKIKIDDSKNVLIAGNFRSKTFSFLSATLDNNEGNENIFLGKIDEKGNLIWVQSFKGNSSNQSIELDKDGNIYMTGYYGSTITFGSQDFTSNGTYDIFLLKCKSDGGVVWVNSIGGISDDVVYDVTSDKNGNIYITGAFVSPSIAIGSTTFIKIGETDFLILKFDPDGNLIWGKNEGKNNSYGEGRCVAIDKMGNLIITGTFRSTDKSFGPYTLFNNGESGSEDIFFLKYSEGGNLLMAKSIGGIKSDIVNNLTKDLNGNFYLIGSFFSPSLSFGSSTLINDGYLNFYVAKLFGDNASIVGEVKNSFLQVYPNPSDGKFIFKVNDNREIINIRSFDLKGKLVKINYENIYQDGVIIHFQESEKGFYFLEVYTDKGTQIFKVLIQ